MAFEDLKKNAEKIKGQAKVYLDTTLAYYKLLVFKVAMKSITLLFKSILILLCFGMGLFFGSVAVAFSFSIIFKSYTLGFMTVAGIYFIATILIFFIKDKFIEGQILKKFSKIFFKG